MLVKLKNCRLAFPQLFTAKAFEDSEPAYSASLLMAKDNPSLKELEEAMKAVAKEKWKDKAQAIYADLVKKDKVCLRDGDGKSEYDGFPGMMYVSARNKSRPLVIDKDKSPLTQSDGKPYGGCYVNANIEVWPQDNQFGKRLNATLLGIQMVKDGDAFSGAAPADPEDFDSVDDVPSTGSDGW